MSSSRAQKRSSSPAHHERRRKIARCQVSPITINFKYTSKEFKDTLKECYQAKLPLKHESDAVFETVPFPVFVLPKFINEKESLSRLKEELLELKFNDKSNDLYTFHQSDDLSNVEIRHIKYIRKLLYGEFRKSVTEITGINLSNKVDMTCSQYVQGDVLLCHDDELEERRIAFILYLVPAWKSEDGGTLDLFDCDNKGQPGAIVKSFVPKWNSLIFFEVSEKSFHQVSEVVSLDKTRLTISGWFHGPPLKRSTVSPRVTLHDFITPQELDEDCLRSWINPRYLKSETQTEIQEKFQEESEIELHSFLVKDKFAEMEKALLANDLCWTAKGPANKYNYQLANTDTLPPIVKECIKVLSSEAMFLILSNITGLVLHRLAAKAQKELDDASASTSKETIIESEINKETAKCRYQVRQFKHGSYTLIQDEDNESMECALDAMLFFNCKDWKFHYGGFTSYIAKDEDEELLSICPSRNSLALVYRDKETLRFVKHINVTMRETSLNCFHDLLFVYYE